MPWRGETEPGTTAVDPWWRARLRVAPESDGPWAVAVRAGWVVPGPTRAAWQGLRVWHGSWGSATLGRARDAGRDEGPACLLTFPMAFVKLYLFLKNKTLSI